MKETTPPLVELPKNRQSVNVDNRTIKEFYDKEKEELDSSLKSKTPSNNITPQQEESQTQNKQENSSGNIIENKKEIENPSRGKSNSSIYPISNTKTLLQNQQELENKKEAPISTKEAIEANETLKNLKWKLEIALNDKLNDLTKELNEANKKIKLKEEEMKIEESLFEKRKRFLKIQIEKEKNKKLENHMYLNYELAQQKNKLEAEIKEMENKRAEMKGKLKEQFNEMMSLRQTLKMSIDELDIIKKEILSRKFAIDDRSIIFEQSQSEDFIEIESEKNSLPHNAKEFAKELLFSRENTGEKIFHNAKSELFLKENNIDKIKKELQNHSAD